MGSKPAGLALVALLATSACQEGVEVAVTQGAEGVVFATDPARNSFQACIDRAYLYSEEPAGPRQIWYATRGSARTPCIRQIRLTSDPAGFSADPPPPLRPGARYRVELMGNGFGASATFAAR